MKKVFSNSELVHVFAAQTQNEGKSQNMFFYDKKIYSYGYHYLLGEFINDSTILINDSGYSNTTQKHISLLRQATRQYKQYFTKQVDLDLVYNQITTLNSKLARAIKKDIICNDIINLFEGLQSFLYEFKKENQLNDVRFLEIQTIYKSIVSNKDTFILAAKEREQKRKQVEKIKLANDLEKFLNYELDYINSKNSNVDYIRLSLDKQFVETSQRVQIDINEAKLLYNSILQGKDIKGYKISNYTVISLNGVLQIGCHRIDKKNMHEVGKQLV
jgi:hypothetical protein